jgi:class 3 adenylate cyclase
MRADSSIGTTIQAAQAEGLAPEAIDRRVWERHGTVRAMLALDSSGMTRVTRSKGIVHFLSRYFEMRDIAQPILTRHGCLAWRSFADNMFSEFPNADVALTAALEIHAAIHEHGIMLTEQEPYRVCIAVGHGRVLDNGALGVLGDEMNIVAKLAEDFAGPGQTLLTEAGYASLTQHPKLRVEKTEFVISKVTIAGYRVCA